MTKVPKRMNPDTGWVLAGIPTALVLILVIVIEDDVLDYWELSAIVVFVALAIACGMRIFQIMRGPDS